MQDRYSYDQAAAQLHLSIRQVKRLKAAGVLGCEQKGTRVWFTRQHLLDYLASRDTRRTHR